MTLPGWTELKLNLELTLKDESGGKEREMKEGEGMERPVREYTMPEEARMSWLCVVWKQTSSAPCPCAKEI